MIMDIHIWINGDWNNVHYTAGIGSPSMSGVNSDLVKTYLACHHEVLEDFIMEFVHTEDLETWLQRKHTNSDGVQGISREYSKVQLYLYRWLIVQDCSIYRLAMKTIDI